VLWLRLAKAEWDGGLQLIFPVSTDLVYQNRLPVHPYSTIGIQIYGGKA
jgi:hypothetical protein